MYIQNSMYTDHRCKLLSLHCINHFAYDIAIAYQILQNMLSQTKNKIHEVILETHSLDITKGSTR